MTHLIFAAGGVWHANAAIDWILTTLHSHGLWFGLLFMIILWAGYSFISKRSNIFWLALGEDGRLSTSKFQFLLWSVVVLYAFISLALARYGHGVVDSRLPQNVLIVMGFSLSTAVGAKWIVVSYPPASQAALAATSLPTPTLNPLYLIANSDGNLDLNKAQMLAWTMIALVSFAFDFFAHFNAYATCNNAAKLCFPDIDQALMVLMGLGQGAYLGGKIVAKP